MTSENAKKTVSLNDYIIDIGGAAAKCSVTYEVVLENNTDFIIKRRTLKTDRELVVLVSKGIYYIKDCKNGNIEELKESSLTTFLRELKDGFIQLHQVHWLSNIYRESVGLIMQVITDEQLTDMCRHNVLVNTFNPSMYSRYWEQNSKLFTRLYNMFPSMTDLRKYQSSIPVIFWIEDQYGANEAMYFAEKLVQSGIMELNYSDSSYYYANDAEGWHLSLQYEGNRTMSVSIDAPKQQEGENASSNSSEPDRSSEAEGNANVLDPDFKAAMDSYEAFMDEYVAFMKKYAESDGSDPGIFTDYADYVNKYATFCADFEQWENEDLNAAETAYYLEVQARVAEKLLTVNQ